MASEPTIAGPQDVDAPPKRRYMHDFPELCQGILSTIESGHGLEIRGSGIEGAGSGLFLSSEQKSIPTGKEIFRSAPLLVCRDPLNSNVCDWCFVNSKTTVHPEGRFLTPKDTPPTITACTTCRVARYCSKTCQKKAWSRHHKYECKIIGTIPNLSAVAQSFYRILLLDKAGKIPNGHWFAIQRMESSFLKFDESEVDDDVMMMAVQAGSVIEGLKHDLSVVWTLYCKLLTNCMNIRPAENETSLGCSLDLAVAMMNHDCNPNVLVFFEGGQVRARSLRKIQAGDELFVSYVDPRMSVARRRTALKANSFIDCTCSTCKKELECSTQMSPTNLHRAQELLAERLQVASKEFYGPYKGNTNEVLQPFLREVQHFKTTRYGKEEWPDNLDPLPLVRLTLADMYGARGDYVMALRYALKGAMSTTCRVGPIWVADLHVVCRMLEKICFFPKDSSAFEETGFVTREQARVILSGYLSELKLHSAKAFGEDTLFAMATAKLAAVYQGAGPDQPPMGHPEFEKRLMNAQLKLFEWATVKKAQSGWLVQMS